MANTLDTLLNYGPDGWHDLESTTDSTTSPILFSEKEDQPSRSVSDIAKAILPPWQPSQQLLGPPTLAALFQPGNYIITKNLMSLLCQRDIHNLGLATAGFDPQFHENLQYIPPPKWVCQDWYHRSTVPELDRRNFDPLASVQVCDGVWLGVRTVYMDMVTYKCSYDEPVEPDPSIFSINTTHDPDMTVCTACSGMALSNFSMTSFPFPIARVGEFLYRWENNVKELPNANDDSNAAAEKPCECLRRLRKLTMCNQCWHNLFQVWYEGKVEDRRQELGDEKVRIWVGPESSTDKISAAPWRKYGCYVCGGFLEGRLFNSEDSELKWWDD